MGYESDDETIDLNPPITAAELFCVLDSPKERSIFTLARVYNDIGPQKPGVPFLLQEMACAFYNKHGLNATLDEIKRLGGDKYFL